MVLRPPGITTMTAKQESQVRRHPLVVYTMESIQSLCNSLCVDHLPMLLHRCQALMLFQTTSKISIFWRLEYHSTPKVKARMFNHPSFVDVMNISWGWFHLKISRNQGSSTALGLRGYQVKVHAYPNLHSSSRLHRGLFYDHLISQRR